MRPTYEPKSTDMDPPVPDPSLQEKIETGRKLSEAIDLYKARQELREIAHVIQLQSLPDRLSPHQFNRLVKQQEDTLHLDQRKKAFRENEPAKLYQGIAYEIVRKLLQTDRSIRSTLNIGCNYAYMDWLLAKEFEKVTFHAIDVNPGLVEINSDLQRENTRFYPGYALEYLESGKVSADLVYTSSASTVIRNAELRTYLRLIAQKSKYFLLSEPIWALPGGEILDPKTIHPIESVPAYLQREPLTGDFGYLCWNHNYRSIINEAGFDIIEYRFWKPEIGPHHWCVVVGQNRNADLWG